MSEVPLYPMNLASITVGALVTGIVQEVTFVSHNVSMKWFYKVDSPTKPSTYCFNK